MLVVWHAVLGYAPTLSRTDIGYASSSHDAISGTDIGYATTRRTFSRWACRWGSVCTGKSNAHQLQYPYSLNRECGFRL
eukprot:2729469-Rhodomonas_salina.2